MILAWVVWPFILLVYIAWLALRRVARRWYVPLIAGAVAFPLSFVGLMYDAVKGPDKVPQNDRLVVFPYFLRWWNRLHRFGISRLLPDSWIAHHQPYPTTKEMWGYALNVMLAASLTVAELAFLACFVLAFLWTIRDLARPAFPGRSS